MVCMCSRMWHRLAEGGSLLLGAWNFNPGRKFAGYGKEIGPVGRKFPGKGEICFFLHQQRHLVAARSLDTAGAAVTHLPKIPEFPGFAGNSRPGMGAEPLCRRHRHPLRVFKEKV